ncbi:MAG: ABC transporter permease [Ignavibacteriales bacterium]|nr:MAG: ABC transporter permease [Ignavibacteriales bacterium]
MFLSYLKIALRNLLRFKAYSTINIAGLAVGMACCILILLYVFDEMSYDRFHKNADRIYRIAVNGTLGENNFNAAVSPPPLRNALMTDYPEVVSATRVKNFGYPVLRYGDKVFSEEKFFWVDSTFFDVFTVEFISGNPATALNAPEKVVLTERMAKKYFGDEDPVGKLINSDNRRDYKITGVVKEFPENSHFHFDFLASLSSYEFIDQQGWLSNDFYTYFLLKEDFPPEEFEAKLPVIVDTHVWPVIERFLNVPREDLKKGGAKYAYVFQPLTDIHLHSHLDVELEPNGDVSYVLIFSLIAAGILLIACINFTNLATARSANRLKEIGVRKTLGSNRQQLIKQFLTESILMTFLAVIISLILIEIALPYFKELVGKDLSLGIISKIYTIPLLVVFILIVGIFAGGYPALYLSSFNPVKVLKKETGHSGKNPWLRNSLVVVQFAVSITLFIGTIIVYNQLDFISNKKLGFNKDQVVVVKKTDDIGRQMESFRNELKNIPGIFNASNSNSIFGEDFGNTPYKIYGTNDNHLINILFADHNFASVYGIEMAKGRYYSEEFRSDTSSIVLNETAARELGIYDDPIGKQIVRAHAEDQVPFVYTVVGVMKDFHYQSLHRRIEPVIIHLYFPGGFGRNVSVKIPPDNIDQKLQEIKTVWHKYAGNQAFEYVFFDEDFAKVYESEKRAGIIVTVFSLLAILIACLGLLGLAAFTTEQRTKEVGIRKILGASVSSIVVLLLKDFAKWVLISNIIAWPIAYFALNKWLEDFAYRINIELWTFVIASLSAIVIAVLTVSYQSIKAAISNPVKSLRYE